MKDYKAGTVVGDNWKFRRGDIYLVNLNPFIGSEQGGTRPCVVVQNNLGNRFAPTLIVLPITSRMGKRGKTTHYLLKNQKGLVRDSFVEAEQPQTIDKSRIKAYLGHVDKKAMREIEGRVLSAFGINSSMRKDLLLAEEETVIKETPVMDK